MNVVIHGGTNVSFSLSFEYLDQVLLPSLGRFGKAVEKLDVRSSRSCRCRWDRVVEDSGHYARIYTLLVAHTSTGLRYGCDWLYDRKIKKKTADVLSAEVAQKVVKALDAELRTGGLVDEHLHDQLIVFQALAEGMSNIPGTKESATSNGEQIACMDEPFGDGSLHTTTARWVTGQILTGVRWFERGRLCEGVGWKSAPDGVDDISRTLEQTHVT